MDQHTEVTYQSWGKRLGMSILALIFVPILSVSSFFILRHSEIQRAKVTFGLKGVIGEVHPDQNGPHGELFLVSDSLKTRTNTLIDPKFGVTAEGLKLHRKSYTYLWTEKEASKTEEDMYGNTKTTKTYTYSKKWIPDSYQSRRIEKDLNIDSRTFKKPVGHENPPRIKQDTIITHAGRIGLDRYYLDDRFYDAMLDFQLWPLQDEHIQYDFHYAIDTQSRAHCPDLKSSTYGQGSWSSSHRSAGKSRSMFIGEGTVETPKVGDIRIEYWYIPTDVYTIVGLKDGNMIRTLQHDSLMIRSPRPCRGIKHTYGYFGFIYPGKMNVKEVFNTAQDENDKAYVIFRLVGLIFMVVAFWIFGNPIALILGWIPVFGKVWQIAIFKIMQLLGTLTALSISTFYFIQNNTILHLRIYDFYFFVGVFLSLFYLNAIRISFNGSRL